jgi:hypothetical protein
MINRSRKGSPGGRATGLGGTTEQHMAAAAGGRVREAATRAGIGARAGGAAILRAAADAAHVLRPAMLHQQQPAMFITGGEGKRGGQKTAHVMSQSTQSSCARAQVRVCVRTCVRAYVCACVRACIRVCVHTCVRMRVRARVCAERRATVRRLSELGFQASDASMPFFKYDKQYTMFDSNACAQLRSIVRQP